jgi:hypothetical protein
VGPQAAPVPMGTAHHVVETRFVLRRPAA